MTTHVGPLSKQDKTQALTAGTAYAQTLIAQGQITAAVRPSRRWSSPPLPALMWMICNRLRMLKPLGLMMTERLIETMDGVDGIDGYGILG